MAKTAQTIKTKNIMCLQHIKKHVKHKKTRKQYAAAILATSGLFSTKVIQVCYILK
jgi:hypothetical protein